MCGAIETNHVSSKIFDSCSGCESNSTCMHNPLSSKVSALIVLFF
jgi:hypothetical protein